MQQYGLPGKQECLTLGQKKSSLCVFCQLQNFTQEKVRFCGEMQPPPSFESPPLFFVFQWYLFLLSSLFLIVIETHRTPLFLSAHCLLLSLQIFQLLGFCAFSLSFKVQWNLWMATLYSTLPWYVSADKILTTKWGTDLCLYVVPS